MQSRSRASVPVVLQAGLALLVVICCSASIRAADKRTSIVLRDSLSPLHRKELIEALRLITGWPDLRFNSTSTLQLGTSVGGSGSRGARALLAEAAFGTNGIVLEDASGNAEVAFCRIVPGRWTSDDSGKPPVYVLQIDFDDFHQIVGDRLAKDAFNVGWGVLHELDHVVTNARDAYALGTTGECEDHVNAMRRELGLPERVEYFYTLFPHVESESFKSRFVRLAFERRTGLKKKRYWLAWDATIVGGVPPITQVATIR